MAYTETTLKRLFALSGNACAFPACANPVVDPDYGVIVGEICHIKGRKEGSARHDPKQTPAQRDGFENLILMCLRHHKVIDDKLTRDQFPVELVYQYKADHEAKFKEAPVNEEFSQRFVAHVIQVEGSIITTINQSGGQVAHTITNIVASPRSADRPKPILKPVIESHMVNTDTQVDYYDFRVRLKNEGSASAREFRVEVEIPQEFAGRTSSHAFTAPIQNRPGMHLYRATEKSWPGTIIYPESESDFQILFSYDVRIDRYATITKHDIIRVKIFADDAVTSTTDVAIADYLSEDRCNMLWPPTHERPEALRQPRKYYPQR